MTCTVIHALVIALTYEITPAEKKSSFNIERLTVIINNKLVALYFQQ